MDPELVEAGSNIARALSRRQTDRLNLQLMPELPEVEAARRHVEDLCAGHVISKVQVYEQGGGPRHGLFDDIIFEDLITNTANTIKDNEVISSFFRIEDTKIEDVYTRYILNKRLQSIRRKGKQLWFDFGPNHHALLFHFGMTGSFVIKDHQVPSYRSFKVDDQKWPPRFCKVLITFSNGIELCFTDPRRLGRIKLRHDPLNTSPIKDLGIDPVTDVIPNVVHLKERMSNLSAPIKSVLLNQDIIFCGIGNYLADEILYQAHIHPAVKANVINTEGITRLLDAMQYILKVAIECNANYDLYPRDWLFHYRWDKAKSKTQAIKMPDGNTIVFEEIAGRTTAIVPKIQHKEGIYIENKQQVYKKSPIKQIHQLDKSELSIITPPPPTGKKMKVEETIVNIKSEVINATRRSARGMIVKVVVDDSRTTGVPLSVEHDDSTITTAPITSSRRKKKVYMGSGYMTAKVEVVDDVIDDAIVVVRKGSRKRSPRGEAIL